MKCLLIANGDVNEAIQLLLETDDESDVDFSDNCPCVEKYTTSSQVQYCTWKVYIIPKFSTVKIAVQ